MRILILLILIPGICWCETEMEFHVAPDGNDSASGTEADPFATLTGARDAIRAIPPGERLTTRYITVFIHGGRYEMAESFRLEAEDNVIPDCRVTYRGVAGDEVYLSGGKQLPPEAFQPVSDAPTLKRLDPAVHGKVLYADLKALGITSYGDYPDAFSTATAVAELFFDRERMQLARWPNEGWAEIESVVESGVPEGKRWQADRPGAFVYSGDRPRRWATAPAVWLHGYWCFDWRSETIRVDTIDLEKREIRLKEKHHYGIGGGNPAPRRYHAVNLLEELDAPKEYYLDRKKGLLYFYPPKALESSQIVLSTLPDPVIHIDGASNIFLQDLTVENGMGTGIRVDGGSLVCISKCRIRNTGLDGVVSNGGSGHWVTGCDIYHTGTAGVRMSGGDRKTLTPSQHHIVNNRIYDVSNRQRTGAYHVHVGGVGVQVAHNLIHHGPHQAIGLAGNDHVIEYNEIHHTGMETDDCGAFYMGRNPSERGSVLRYNYWHDIGSTFTHGSCAVYFDDGSGGQRVYGNVFYRAAGGNFGAVFSHGGHDNHVENNIFIDCKTALGAAPWDDRRWQADVESDSWQDKLLKQVDITSPLYLERYPDLEGFLTFPAEPRFNHAARNLIINCGRYVTGNWTLLFNCVRENEEKIAALQSAEEVLEMAGILHTADFVHIPDFEPIPVDRIGLTGYGISIQCGTHCSIERYQPR